MSCPRRLQDMVWCACQCSNQVRHSPESRKQSPRVHRACEEDAATGRLALHSMPHARSLFHGEGKDTLQCSAKEGYKRSMSRPSQGHSCRPVAACR